MPTLYPGDRVSVISAGVDGTVQGVGDGAAHGLPGERCVLVLHDGAGSALPHYPAELRRLPPVTSAGVYDLPDLVYQRDPCPEPSLNPSILVELLSRSALHAATLHPRIGRPRDVERLDFDLGKAAHALLLGGEDALSVIDAADYRSNAAKGARELAYAEGRIPVLAPRMVELADMAAAARAQLAANDCGVLDQPGLLVRPVLACPDSRGCWLRCRPDVVAQQPGGRVEVYQYTTTAGSAHPARWGGRTLWGLGPDGEVGRDVPAAFEAGVVRAVIGAGRLVYRFIVQEAAAPYALTVIELPAAALAHAACQVERGVAAWAHCLVTHAWPGYAPRVAMAETPPWLRPAMASMARLAPLPGDPPAPVEATGVDDRLAAFLT